MKREERETGEIASYMLTLGVGRGNRVCGPGLCRGCGGSSSAMALWLFIVFTVFFNGRYGEFQQFVFTNDCKFSLFACYIFDE